MDVLRQCVQYAQGILLEKTGRQNQTTEAQGLTSQQQAQIDRIVEVVLEASKNPVVVPYTVEDLLEVVESKVAHKDEKLREMFAVGASDEGQELPLEDRPKVHLDMEGRIVGWYLPSLFSSQISVSTVFSAFFRGWDTDQAQEHVLASTARLGAYPETVLGIKRDTKNWRYDPKTYTPTSECGVPPGHVAFSPCWYELGHDHTNSQPAPSVSLRNPAGGGIGFLKDEIFLNALLGALLAIVHPDLYEMQVRVLERLNNGRLRTKVKHGDTMHAALEHWSSPFTGLAVISNRETPFHRDTRGGKLLYDLVATFGAYRGGRFEVPLFGNRYLYNPGTAFILPGYLLEHGASKVTGDRVCIANFFKPNVGHGAFTQYKEIPPPTIDILSGRYGIVITA
ncbi:hypothetical protein NMY22_g3493 [Coprinellus aureogranulatus]|nr:hypothetical protein NMY22_g3493 [Coprinellus aureogranulatus]